MQELKRGAKPRPWYYYDVTAEPHAHGRPSESVSPPWNDPERPTGPTLVLDEKTVATPSYQQFLEALDVAVYTTDAQGRITFYNQAAVAFWGRTPEVGEMWCGSWKLYWPNGDPMAHGECPMAIALRSVARSAATRALRSDPTARAFPSSLSDSRHRCEWRHDRGS